MIEVFEARESLFKCVSVSNCAQHLRSVINLLHVSVNLARPPVCDAPIRTVLLEKPPEGSVGIRLTGGNKVGIFVSAVQPGIAASLQGLQPGDKLLKVNQVDMTGVTREDAAMFLLRVQDRVTLEVQHCKQGKKSVVFQSHRTTEQFLIIFAYYI